MNGVNNSSDVVRITAEPSLEGRKSFWHDSMNELYVNYADDEHEDIHEYDGNIDDHQDNGNDSCSHINKDENY